MQSLWVAAALSFATPVAQDTDAEMKKLTLDRMLEWEDVRSPKLSPDGAEIVFSRSWVDKVNDRRKSHLWIMNADSSRPRFLTEGSSAVWSPDGARIAFLKEGEPQGSQVHVMWRDTREVTQITRVEESPSGLQWSPDGEHLAFSMVVPEKLGFDISLPKRPKGAKWAEDPKVITRLNYRRDQSGYRPAGYRHLFVVDAEGGTPRQVTSGDYDHGAGEWTADGARLVFSGNRVEDADWQVRESEVYSVDVESGEVVQLTTRAGPDFGPRVSPDGRFIAYLGWDKNDDTYSVAQLHVMEVDGGTPRVLSAGLDRQIAGFLWAKDSEQIYLNANTLGARQLFSVDLRGRLEQLTWGDVVFSASDVGHDGTVVGVYSDAHLPGDVARITPFPGISAEFEILTAVNEDVLHGVTLGDVQEFRFASTDDFGIQGWVIKPPDFDPAKKYPLILQIHGGPHAMYNCAFNFERQNHAAEGYVVVYCNPRGSTGYGKVFGNAIKNAYPSKDYDDLMGAVDQVIAQGWVDADNLFVYGGSGGGVLTCWIVGHTERFTAAVSMFPVTNWISFVGTTDGPYWYHNFAKMPWEDIAEHWQRSPLKYVGNVTTPTMLITGELDLRTPMGQTEEYYQALKYRKVDTVMVRVPGEYHGAGRRPSNAMRRILYVRGWFDKYQGAEEAEAEESVGTR